MIDPDGPLRPLRPPRKHAGDTLAAEAARRIKRDAALARAIEILGNTEILGNEPRY